METHKIGMREFRANLAEDLDAMIASWGASEEELIEQYKEIRRASRERKRRNAK